MTHLIMHNFMWKNTKKKQTIFHFAATLDNLETKLSIQDDNDSISIDTISESIDIKSESSANSVDGKIRFIGQNGTFFLLKSFVNK